MATWDVTFEYQPQDSDDANDGANQIRILKKEIGNRCELEMNWETDSRPLLKAGVAAVCYQGNATDISALGDDGVNMSNGALAYDNELYVFKHYWGGSWANAVIYHNELGNLAVGDPHTQYLKLDKECTLTANLAVDAGITIDGVDISNHATANLTTVHSGGILGTLDTTSFAANANYTASTDGFVMARVFGSHVGIAVPYGSYRVTYTYATTGLVSACCPIKKGETWHVTTTIDASAEVDWFPIGS